MDSLKNIDSERLFAQIAPSWREILQDASAKPKLVAALLQADADYKELISAYSCEGDDIFRAFKNMSLESTRVCIVIDAPLPTTIRKIYLALQGGGCIQQIPYEYDLSGWCEQGILLLSRQLTTTTSGKEHTAWRTYTDFVLQQLAQTRNNIIIAQWGSIPLPGIEAYMPTRPIVLPAREEIAEISAQFAKIDAVYRTIYPDSAPLVWDPEAVVLVLVYVRATRSHVHVCSGVHSGLYTLDRKESAAWFQRLVHTRARIVTNQQTADFSGLPHTSVDIYRSPPPRTHFEEYGDWDKFMRFKEKIDSIQ